MGASKSRVRLLPFRFALTLAVLCIGFQFSTATNCSAQGTTHDFGSWFALLSQGRIGSCKHTNWRWWFDGHLRYLDDSDGFNQSIIRPGVGYALTDKATIWAGYGWINELPASGNPVFDENRIWQQITWSDDICGGKVSLRGRLEQRFVETGNDTGWRYRQFAKYLRPIAGSDYLSLSIWDEAFFDLNSTDWGQNASFSQNRAFVGLGYKFQGQNSPRLEVGYLNQFLRRRSNDDRNNHILSTNWFFKF
ncbi:MAG: DUF2490 domain-containing protein [Planctomycetota bacterium]